MRVPSRCIIAFESTSTFAPCCSTSSSSFPFSSARARRSKASEETQAEAECFSGACQAEQSHSPEYVIV